MMANTVVGVQATSEAPYSTGAVYSCDLGETEDTKGLVFYVLKSTTDTVSLLMEDNVGSQIAWCASGNDNSCAADGAISHLNSQTEGWSKIFEVDGTVSLPSKNDIDVVTEQNWPKINLNPIGTEHLGFWLSTASDGQSNMATAMIFNGDIYDADVDSEYAGVRPLITISKENLSL